MLRGLAWIASQLFDKLKIKEDFTTFLDNLRYRELELKPLGKTKFKIPSLLIFQKIALKIASKLILSFLKITKKRFKVY